MTPLKPNPRVGSSKALRAFELVGGAGKHRQVVPSGLMGRRAGFLCMLQDVSMQGLYEGNLITGGAQVLTVNLRIRANFWDLWFVLSAVSVYMKP